jgi:hypothetical protein
METNFMIEFTYELTPAIKIVLAADVKLLHSDPHYLVQNISHPNDSANLTVLPNIEIKAIRDKNNKVMWVHTDSGKETLLSRMAGEAIARSHPVELSKN